MALPGNWTLHYDWGCGGTYSSTDMIFKADGTWTMPSFGYMGQWVEVSGEIIFNASIAKTIYAGNIAGHAAVGIMTTFTGFTGCWYLIQSGQAAARKAEPGRDPLGEASNLS